MAVVGPFAHTKYITYLVYEMRKVSLSKSSFVAGRHNNADFQEPICKIRFMRPRYILSPSEP